MAPAYGQSERLGGDERLLSKNPPTQVQQLLEMGADVTAKDKRGISALHYASGQGRLEVLQFLWSKGLDLDADDPGLYFQPVQFILPRWQPCIGGVASQARQSITHASLASAGLQPLTWSGYHAGGTWNQPFSAAEIGL